MKVPYSWIKEFVDLDLPAEIVAEKLNISGIETAVSKFGKYTPNLTTVKVLSVEKHPEKDKLYICQVSDGINNYQVVTGADNVKTGNVVIFAKVGAKILGKEIKPIKFGSYESQGMLVSLEELEIEDKSEGIFILDHGTPIGADPNYILGLGEDILEIEITPNRGDALSVRGLAREIAAIFRLKRKDYKPNITLPTNSLDISIQTDKVYRYVGILIKNITIKDSPLDIRLKLLKSGISVINNIVDITNYIMIQEGQPLHAFDYEKIEGNLSVRYAKEGEKIVTLDGEERILSSTDIVIADSKKAVAIAGIIGGENSKIDENTKHIILESAIFDPISVRKTAKRLGILTDSSYRFERGVDIENTFNASCKAADLILNLSKESTIESYKDIYLKPYQPKTVILKSSYVEKILGEKLDNSEIKDILGRLEIDCTIENGTLNIKIPSFRSYDLERSIDLVEEVARIYGYDNFNPTYPKIDVSSFEKSKYWHFDNKVRTYFLNNGFTEVVNYTFTSEDIYSILKTSIPNTKIVNYILKSHSVMRDRLAVSLIENLKENLRFSRKDLSIFELSSAFYQNFEEIRVSGLVSGKIVDGFSYNDGKRQFNTNVDWDFLILKGVLSNLLDYLGIKNHDFTDTNLENYLHPYISANIYVKGNNVGYIGKIHPEIATKLEIPKDTFIFELKLRYVSRGLEEAEALKEGYLYTYYLEKDTPKFRELSKYPSAYRDLAFVVDKEVKAGELKDSILKSSVYIKDIKLFDVYYLNEDKKSIAFKVEFNNPEKSLSDEELNILVEDILSKLKLYYPDISLRM